MRKPYLRSGSQESSGFFWIELQAQQLLPTESSENTPTGGGGSNVTARETVESLGQRQPLIAAVSFPGLALALLLGIERFWGPRSDGAQPNVAIQQVLPRAGSSQSEPVTLRGFQGHSRAS